MNKTYPIDIFGIKRIGIKKWLSHYYIPVSSSEYQNIYNSICSIYFSTINEFRNNEIIYYISIANWNIVTRISHNLVNILRLQRLREKGYKDIVSNKKEDLVDAINLYKFYLHSNNSPHVLDKLTRKERSKNAMRTIKYNLNLKIINKLSIKNIRAPFFLVGDGRQQKVLDYCKERKISPLHLSPLLFSKRNFSDQDLNTYLPYILELCNAFVEKVLKEFPLLTIHTCDSVKSEVEDFFKYSLIYFLQNVDSLNKIKTNKTLLATGLGNDINRLFCSAWRYTGGKVVGFAHGYNYYREYFPGTIRVMSVVDQYVTTSEESAKDIQKATQDFSPLKENGVPIYIKRNHYYPLFNELQRAPKVKKIKKVMVIGFPVQHNAYYQYTPAGYSYAHLLFEIQVLQLLKSEGYHTIYKPHPIGSDEIEDIFDGNVDEILKERLEDVYHKADCLLFGEMGCSAFGYSMLTNKPLVLVNAGDHILQPEAFEMLKKRCCVVHAEERGGVITFDDRDLKIAIESSLNNISYDIIYKYAF